MNLGPENETVEYKKSTSELREGVASIASILNKHGKGELYFGVKNNGDVCGMQVADTTLRDIGQTIDQSIEPRVHPTVEKLDDGEGNDYIRIAFSGSEAPYSCKGVFRLRVSDSDVLMSASEVRRMSVKAHYAKHPWDEELNDTPIGSVEVDALKDYIERGQAAGRINFKYKSVEDALARLGLFVDGHLTNAAVVLFCRPRDIMLKTAVFATTARINILDMQQERENLFRMAKMAEDYIMRNIKWRFIITGAMQRDEVPEIPRAAVREAIINAFCHRDYTSNLAVQVDVFGEKIEIFSPGGFPDGITPDRLMEDDAVPYSKSRNGLIAQTLFKSKDIESYGTGIKRIKDLCDRADIRFEYKNDPQGTVLCFYRPNWFEEENASAGSKALTQGKGMRRADRAREREEAALRIARSDGKVTTASLVDATGAGRRTAATTLKKLADSGKLEWHGTSLSDPTQYYTIK